MKTIKGPAIFLAQLMDEKAPFNSFPPSLVFYGKSFGFYQFASLKVLSAAKVSGVVNLTLLPFECVKFNSLTMQPP